MTMMMLYHVEVILNRRIRDTGFFLVTDLGRSNIISQMMNKSSNGPFQVECFDMIGFLAWLVDWCVGDVLGLLALVSCFGIV